MIRMLPTVILICFFGRTYSQNENPLGDKAATQDSLERFVPVDIMPEFPGGLPKFYSYIEREFKCSAKNRGADKKIFIEFIVDSTGYVRRGAVNFVKGDLGHICRDRIISVLENSPKWIPGRITEKNKNVPVRFVLPLNLK